MTNTKTTTRTLALVLIETLVEVIETTGEPVPPTPRSVHPGPGLAKCLPHRELRLVAGGPR